MERITESYCGEVYWATARAHYLETASKSGTESGESGDRSDSMYGRFSAGNMETQAGASSALGMGRGGVSLQWHVTGDMWHGWPTPGDVVDGA